LVTRLATQHRRGQRVVRWQPRIGVSRAPRRQLQVDVRRRCGRAARPPGARALGAHLVDDALLGKKKKDALRDAEGPGAMSRRGWADRRLGNGLADVDTCTTLTAAENRGETLLPRSRRCARSARGSDRRDLALEAHASRARSVGELQCPGHQVDAEPLLRADQSAPWVQSEVAEPCPLSPPFQQQRLRARTRQAASPAWQVAASRRFAPP